MDEARAIESLEKFKRDIHLPKMESISIDHILDLVKIPGGIAKLDKGSLEDMLGQLTYYNLCLNHQENRLISYFNWCENHIKMIVGRELENAPSNFYNEKDCYIRANHEKARELSEKKNETQVKIDSIKWTSQKIGMIIDMLQKRVYDRR